MKNLTFSKIANKLHNLAEKQPKVYKDFYISEQEYIQEMDNFLINAQSLYSNQPSREAYARKMIKELPIYKNYTTALYEKTTLDYQTKVLIVIAKIMQSQSFRDINGIGGD